MARARAGLWWAVSGAVLALLVLLAALQYRWIGQVSQAERERMRAGLRAATTRLAGELDGELTRAFAAFQAGRPFPPGAELSGYAERFAAWHATAPYPGLVANFFLTEGGAERLLVLQRESGRFEPLAWPPEMLPLRARLEAGPPPLGVWVEEASLAVVAPRFRPPRLPRPGEPGPGPPPVPGWSIAQLDRAFVQKALLPELVERHFAGAGGLDYQVLVISKRGLREVIYRSEPALEETAVASPDAAISILGVHPEPVARFLRLPPGPPPGPLPEPDSGRWLLLAKHRTGSLEAAVGQARRRSLGVSAAILLVLAGSIFMLVVLTHRAQRLARLQMDLVAGISHELRTPLSVICSAADNLADGVISGPEQGQRYGALIRQEGRRLVEMVEEILGYAAAQAGRLRYELRPVDVAQAVDKATEEAGGAVEKHIEAGLPPVRADANALLECLRNLVHNARKYSQPGACIQVRAQRQGEMCAISVSDQGAGIEPGDVPHIFEPFYRGRRAAASQVRGAGLGLALVKRVVEAHGGSVGVRSALGQGSCFTLQWPLARGSSDESQDSAG